jgi:hypothetical protein
MSPVAPPIRNALLFPVRPIVLWQAVALGTSVPKASVYKNSQLGRAKCKVRLAWKIYVSAPTGWVGFSQKTNEGNFGCFVAFRTNARHVVRALPRSEPVCHFKCSALIRPNLLKSLLEPSQQKELIIDCGSANLFQKFDAARLRRRGILKAFIAVSANYASLIAAAIYPFVPKGAPNFAKCLFILYPDGESTSIGVRAG